ncbi:MAG: hypothetical protein A3J28_18805 [Acidobacteria bacterium RIFCSPLOWO2_12_FULL_60_22]|nr:MAG: hypothetical protein A3J28_18805 [Acidobacteria bacterium RIFCSPLOWO2_12_FULL_60_22]
MSQSIQIFSLPTGRTPMGIAIVGNLGPVREDRKVFVVVANSEEDSVSIFEILSTFLVQPRGKIEGIPRPYGVSSCGSGRAVITSPTQNRITIIQLPEATILGSLQVGARPYSVACFSMASRRTAAVSNFGDSTLTLVDIDNLSVIGQASDVPGSSGWRGVSIGQTPSGSQFTAWVAGTEANQVTLVDLGTLRVLARLSVPRPTAIYASFAVGSAGRNSIMIFDTETLRLADEIPNVTNPQDILTTSLGNLAVLGGLNAIWNMHLPGGFISGPGRTITTIPVPGATGLAGYSSTSRPDGPGLTFVTSPNSNSLYVLGLGSGNPPREFGVTDVGAPGMLASAFASTGVNQILYAEGVPLPKQLGGVTVRVGGTFKFDITAGWTYSPVGAVEAPILFVNPNQVNFQIPPGVALGNLVPVQLQRPDGSMLLSITDILAASPRIFTVLMNFQGQAAALNQDNSQNGNPQSILGAKPAARGSVIQIYATGAGETDPPLLPGEPAPASGNPLILNRVLPQVTIGGIAARVLFSGMAPGFVGLWQINAEVPPAVPPGPAVPLVINAGGVSSNTVTIAVE